MKRNVTVTLDVETARLARVVFPWSQLQEYARERSPSRVAECVTRGRRLRRGLQVRARHRRVNGEAYTRCRKRPGTREAVRDSGGDVRGAGGALALRPGFVYLRDHSPQQRPRALQLRAHGARRYAHVRGDLRVAVSDKPAFDDISAPRRKAIKKRTQVQGTLGTTRHGRAGAAIEQGGVCRLQTSGGSVLAPASPPDGNEEIRTGYILASSQRVKRSAEDVVNDVLGRSGIVEHLARDPAQSRQMSLI
jgi:hypothetical protein